MVRGRKSHRRQAGVIRPSSARVSLTCSMRWPYGTEDGQAGSQPRHWTHVSKASRTASVTAASWYCTCRMSMIRPRGDLVSSPVTRYVGQWGRHSPQDTQVSSAGCSRRRSINEPPDPGPG